MCGVANSTVTGDDKSRCKVTNKSNGMKNDELKLDERHHGYKHKEKRKASSLKSRRDDKAKPYSKSYAKTTISAQYHAHTGSANAHVQSQAKQPCIVPQPIQLEPALNYEPQNVSFIYHPAGDPYSPCLDKTTHLATGSSCVDAISHLNDVSGQAPTISPEMQSTITSSMQVDFPFAREK